MSQPEVMKQRVDFKKGQTLVRRVSDLFKDGTYSRPPSLFKHSSMQKIRHCCQNLNLFPYLLYSFDNSKSHPLAKKVNARFAHILRKIVARVFLVLTSLHFVAINEIPSGVPVKPVQTNKISTVKTAPEFTRSLKQKPKQVSCFLRLAIYLAPLVLAFQLVALGSLLILENLTPGFIFLFGSLLCLAYISFKIMINEKTCKAFKREKRKVE